MIKENKNRMIISAVVMAVLLIPLIVGTYAAPTALAASAGEKPIKLKMAYTWVESTNFGQTDGWICSEVEKRSGGRVKFTYLPSGSMGKGSEMLSIVRSGAVDLTQINPAYWPGDMPLWQLLTMQIFRDHSEAIDVANRIALFNEKTATLLREEEASHNIRMIFQSGSENGYVFTSKNPIKTLEELKGKKVRSFGRWAPSLYKKLGCSAVTVMVAEMYDALHKGVIHVNCLPYYIQALMKIPEVAPYVSFSIGASAGYGMLVMNLDSWNSLPKDIQKIFIDIYPEAIEREKKNLADMDEKIRKQWKFCDVSEKDQEYIYTLWEGVVDKWMNEMEKKGFGEKAKFMVKALNDELAKYRK